MRRSITARERESVSRILSPTAPVDALSDVQVMLALVDTREEAAYLRTEFVQALDHYGLMLLMRELTNVAGRDHADDLTLDAIALELARRQSPLCRVCALGETGECDERCDRIAGA